jgi:teichuronic acid biosynthesis glycosyltransferase TuaH
VPTSHDIVLSLSLETWDDVVSREFARPPDRLARHLLTSGNMGRVLVANPWRSLQGAILRRLSGRVSASFPATDTAWLTRPMRLRRADPGTTAALRRSYRAYDRVIHHRAHRQGMERPTLITYNPFHAAFGDHAGYRSVTYVGRDDWASHHRFEHLWDVYRDAYDSIRSRGIRVAAVSQEILDRMVPRGPSRVVPNGVDPGVWTQSTHGTDPFTGLARPLALYTGTIDQRLSLEGIESLSKVAGSIVLLGTQTDDTAVALAEQHDNIVALPSVGQADLASAVANADVCVVPHVRNALTRAMSPLKVYEYLAAGRPVVATDLPPIRGIHPSIHLVEGDDFSTAFRVALERGPLAESERLSFIANNSWSSRCEAILDLALQA